MSKCLGTVKEAAVDYLSLTFKPGWNRESARARVHVLQDAEGLSGEDSVPFRLRSYVGVATGRVAWGDRPDGSLLQLAGATADAEAAELLPLASNCTRIDLAVTAHLSDSTVNPTLEGYAAGVAYQPKRGKAPAYELLQHSQLGSTLYLGSPTSSRRGRVYNKFDQSRQEWYAGCFRWECQLNSQLAARGAARVLAAEDRRAYISAYVHRYFTERRVPAYFDPSGPTVPLDSFRPRTNDLSRIMWLGLQVKPVVNLLLAHGRQTDVAAALGLGEPSPTSEGLPADVGEWIASVTEHRVNPVGD